MTGIDDWPRFDRDERTEDIQHLRMRAELKRIDHHLIATEDRASGEPHYKPQPKTATEENTK